MATSKDNPTTETESTEPAPAKKTTTRKTAAKKPEVVSDTSNDETTAHEVKTAENITPKSSYEFLEELPNKQQAAPVVAKAESNPDTRITSAIYGDETEPKKVEADKAFDLETQQTPAAEGKPEPEPAPAEVDQPEIDGVSKTTDVRPTAYIEEGETELEPVEKDKVFAEGTSKTLEPNPGRVGGEGDRYDPEAYNAASSEQEKPKKTGKAEKTDNPKLSRLRKYKDKDEDEDEA